MSLHLIGTNRGEATAPATSASPPPRWSAPPRSSPFDRIVYALATTHGRQGLKGLNLVRCGIRNMFGLVGDIPPQRG